MRKTAYLRNGSYLKPALENNIAQREASVDGLQKGAYVIKKCVLVEHAPVGYIGGTEGNGAC